MTAIASKLNVSTSSPAASRRSATRPVIRTDAPASPSQAGRSKAAGRAARVSAKARPGLVMPRAKKAVRKKDPGTYLSMYFRDMAALDVLRPEEEFVAAREIEDLELALWRQLLGFAPALDAVMAAGEGGTGQTAGLRALRKAAGTPGKASDRLVRAIDKAAGKLREADQDKLFVEAALGAVDRLALGIGCRGIATPKAPARARGFTDWLRRVDSCDRA